MSVPSTPPEPNPRLAWLSDPHFITAALAALPVWLALGFVFDGRMQVVVGVAGWASFVLLQPVLEEFVFRGIVQGLLLRLSAQTRTGPLSVANLITTTAFVTLHLVSQPVGWALSVAIPSLIFGHMRDRFGTVAPAMVLHAFYNAGFAVTAWLAQR
jgi:membrane protease YdiL (CAAX protease family)